MISVPCFVFRFPVGSSARISFGFATKALARLPTVADHPTIGQETGLSFQQYKTVEDICNNGLPSDDFTF